MLNKYNCGVREKEWSNKLLASTTPRSLGRDHRRKYLQNDEIIQSAPPPASVN